MNTKLFGVLFLMVTMSLMRFASAEEWPVLKTYSGAALRRVKMPMGGIGTLSFTADTARDPTDATCCYEIDRR